MNIERWVRSRKPTWNKLEELVKRIERQGLHSLSPEELKELGRLYKSTSADLSRARALDMGGAVPAYLNNLVVKAHNQVYQTAQNRWQDFGHFLWVTFPGLVRQNILYVGAAVVLFMGPLVYSYAMMLQDVEFGHLEISKDQPLIPEAMWHMIAKGRMWTDGAESFSPMISGFIAANNIKVAILSFAMGITFGVGTVYVLLVNGLMIGTVLGACKVYGMASRLAAFVVPHGILELSAIFISAGAGLKMGKALLFPGNLRRVDALKIAARPALKMFGGCVPILLLAGVIEGFISPRTDLSPDIKFAVSIATAVSLLAYIMLPRSHGQKNDAEGDLAMEKNLDLSG